MSDSPNQALINKYQAILVSNGYTNESYNITNVTSEVPSNLAGENKGSTCKLVTLTLENGNSTMELFVKEKPSSDSNIEIPFDLLFKKEAGFFNEILPELQNRLQRPLDFLPKCLYADEQEIILENLTRKINGMSRYVMHSKIARQSLDQAKIALAHLAKFHAISFWRLQEAAEKLKFLAKYPYLSLENIYTKDNLHLTEMSEMVIGLCLKIIGNKECKIINDKGYALAMATFERYKGNIMNTIINQVDRSTAKAKCVFPVLTHGDYWNNNMLWKVADPKDSDSAGAPPIVIIDFQGLRVGSPNLDLVYYMFTSLPYQTRREHWKSLLEMYFNEFKEFVLELRQLNSDLVVEFPHSFQAFVEDFRSNCFLGFWLNIMYYLGAEIIPHLKQFDIELLNDEEYMFQIVCRWLDEFPDKAAVLAENLVNFCTEFEELNLKLD